ncbi:hypothetical protein [Sphingomonas sp. Leaf20]|uniref:hypothetical protein n=1 Tax=Sphingomonas sp. Leaf20 TaxID=1735685 RepID=UPI0006F8BB07|nr:hypothetical protein [Sphingomonas sp. Leaf20]KQM73715.1 hypothetical protein ASE72_03675 [Sphingomonas sp. Leaf20]
MTGFSIDLAADRIVDHRSRAYFVEVSRSFSNDCYRSAIVMLWTVVVCDMVYKLQSLRDLYADAGAGKLLQDVEAKRTVNPNSPDWEIYLLDQVFARTKILEASEHVQLQHLQKLRHLSAHPVLSGADLLFLPTKEDTRAQIRVALGALLLKPPMFSKRIVEALVEDIAANKALLISREKLKAYIEARYLPNIPPAIELEIIRALWKFCFKLDKPETQANRQINLDTLAILCARNPVPVRLMIDSERAVFSNVGPEVEALDALVQFLGEHPELYASLDSAAHILIDGRIDADINNLVRARFKSVDMADHLANLATKTSVMLAKIDDDVWIDLLDAAVNEGHGDEAVRIAVKIYAGSGSYDAADRRFRAYIEPALPRFNLATMRELLEEIDVKPQTYGRGRASFDHSQIRDAATALGLDTTTFKNFTTYI